MYLHLVMGEPAPLEYTVWQLAERFGWTLEYVESLPLGRLAEFYQIQDGIAAGRKGRAHG